MLPPLTIFIEKESRNTAYRLKCTGKLNPAKLDHSEILTKMTEENPLLLAPTVNSGKCLRENIFRANLYPENVSIDKNLRRTLAQKTFARKTFIRKTFSRCGNMSSGKMSCGQMSSGQYTSVQIFLLSNVLQANTFGHLSEKMSSGKMYLRENVF
jgi:hypothetical protein